MEIETNAKIVSETRQLSERCVELITRISLRKTKKASLYMITSTGQDKDVEEGIHVDINPTASERSDEEEEGMPGNPFVYVPPRVQMRHSQGRGTEAEMARRKAVQEAADRLIDEAEETAATAAALAALKEAALGKALPTPQPDKDGNRTFLEVSIPSFELVSRPIITPTKEILNKMDFSSGLTPVNDLFNDKLDYTVSKGDSM